MKLKYTVKTVKVSDDNTIGNDARSIREAKSLSLRQFALRMGISAMFLCDLERGRRGWTPALVAKFNSAASK